MIVYRKRFQNKLSRLLSYLEEKFGESSAYKFLFELEDVVSNAYRFPEAGQPTAVQNVRSRIVGKHIRIYYEVEKAKMTVLNLYDMRIHPSKNIYTNPRK